ncbi:MULTISPECIES: SMI1/KNR4 family protein [Streptomyces]|uniref:SMI1/KNR4 family protein n=1 Tax=Streptomyces TaxID=1883 RepID=UPI000516FADD|nr:MULTISPECIES: SMI1/KNR4 family protein [Streptomyces]MCX4487080.1 SMI1/KNR4 family protein [Streptomyces anulatus]MCX4522806.1 SMI1/KNR4 family protein [Streptomyces anulatus]MCX4605817.1 SMI1/KNR4 family protein [Streptomyces anulatus]WSI81820.1 SMI1/KNR4 family protein [Streptomyces anulatus]WTD14141.1 SMI1/KNR4 family protein [Streptomyces anulatus]
MNVDGLPSVSVSWRRIDAWLAVHAPASLALLNPPVDPDGLESVERVLGIELPTELGESLRCHDGASDWTSLLPEQSPLGAAGIAERWQMLTEIATENDGLATRPWDDEPWWHPLWIPWAESADGNAHVLDLRPGSESGRLGWAGHGGCGDFSDEWQGLAEYLHEVSQALSRGGGVRGMYPYLTSNRQLWWDLGPDCLSLDGEPLTAAPTGLG